MLRLLEMSGSAQSCESRMKREIGDAHSCSQLTCFPDLIDVDKRDDGSEQIPIVDDGSIIQVLLSHESRCSRAWLILNGIVSVAWSHWRVLSLSLTFRCAPTPGRSTSGATPAA